MQFIQMSLCVSKRLMELRVVRVTVRVRFALPLRSRAAARHSDRHGLPPDELPVLRVVRVPVVVAGEPVGVSALGVHGHHAPDTLLHELLTPHLQSLRNMKPYMYAFAPVTVRAPVTNGSSVSVPFPFCQ